MKFCHVSLLFLNILLIFMTSCYKDSPKPNPTVSNTVLVYLAADNSLSGISSSNMDQMIAGMAKCQRAANLLVYVDDKDAPRLYLIKKDSKGNVNRALLKQYEEHNSASKEVMQSVIQEAFERYPAEHRGLILWSHGLNWFPVGFYGSNVPAQARQGVSGIKRSFGQDFVSGKSIEMSLPDLVEAIPDIDLDFIAFDACYMGSVEVAYALRNKAKYLIASPTEILEDGFPYKEVLYYMLTGEPQTTAIAQNYFNHYNSQSGIFRSASISVVDLFVMDQLADWTKRNNQLLNHSFNINDLQHFDRLSYRCQFDFRHIYSVASTASDLAVRMAELDEILKRLVVYKAATPYFICSNDGTPISQGFQIKHFCGLSSYFETTSSYQVYNYLNQAYRQTDWYQATH